MNGVLSILAASLAFLRDHWRPLWLLAFLAWGVTSALLDLVGLGVGLLGLGLAVAAALEGALAEGLALLGTGGAVYIAVQLALTTFVIACATLYVVGRHDACPLGLVESARRSLPRLLAGVGTLLVSGLLVALVYLTTVLPGLALLGATGADPSAWLITIVHLPTLYVGLGLLLSVEISAVEQRGVLASLGRAWRLMVRHRLQAFFAVGLPALVCGLLLVVAEFGIDLLVSFLGLSFELAMLVSWCLQTSVSALCQAWMLVVAALLYLSLRGARRPEAPGAEHPTAAISEAPAVS